MATRDLDGEPRLRPGADADSADTIAVVLHAFAEYPGCWLDVDREEPELRTPARCFDGFWVVEAEGSVVGCVACRRAEAEKGGAFVELKKMYLARDLRGRGWGRRLVERVESWARSQGLARVELWTDTRFEGAHAVYSHLGYRPTGRERQLGDLSRTTELHYVRDL